MKLSTWLVALAILLLGALAAVSAATALRSYTARSRALRGVAQGATAAPPRLVPAPYGVDVSLDSDPADLDRSLAAAKSGGYLWLVQRFPWADIEPQRGQLRWEVYDRIVDGATARGLRIIAVLDTSPSWARRNPLPTSPPDSYADYAAYVRAFVTHYKGRIQHVQIWDQPNIRPYWGERWASPAEYVALLKQARQAAKLADANVQVLAGSLAPTTADDNWNLNDVTFLRRMYDQGAAGAFDILAAKAYGFWTGPDDRRVSPDVLNFSRLVALHEEMARRGDATTPLWATAMGWSALPEGWTGRPSPWGSDTEAVQAERTVAALRRAQLEWPWLGVTALNGLRFADAPADDPRRGFALLDDDFSPRPVYTAVQQLAAEPPVAKVGLISPRSPAVRYSAGWQQAAGGADAGMSAQGAGQWLELAFRGAGVSLLAPGGQAGTRLAVAVDGQQRQALDLNEGAPGSPGRYSLARGLADGTHTLRLQTEAGPAAITGFEIERRFLPWYRVPLIALPLLALLGALVGVAVLMPRLPWQMGTTWAERIPAPVYLALLASLALGYYLAPGLALAAPAALLFAALAVFRLDLALLVTAVTFPFYLYPRSIGGQAFSLPEALLVLCAAAWLAYGLGARVWGWRGAFRWLTVAFVAVAVLSLPAAESQRLALRELRVTVVEPALFYVLAVAAWSRRRSASLETLAWAVLLGAALAAAQALAQLVTGGRVITAEGVLRVVGPYGSPNNLGLLLERALPLALGLAVANWLRGSAQRRQTALAGLGGIVVAAGLFLTYSLGAWLSAVAGVLAFAWGRGRRMLAGAVVAMLLLALALLPLLQVERVVSHLDLQADSTSSIRLAVWRSSLAMIHDHLLQGVGLDGFLEAYRTRYILPQGASEPNLSHPHNVVLEWWLSLGILGPPLLVWFVVAFFRRARRTRARLPGPQGAIVLGAAAAMVAALVHGLVDRFYFGAPDLAFIFFVLLVLVEWPEKVEG